MHFVNRQDAGYVDQTSEIANPGSDLGPLAHAPKERDQGAAATDDEGVVQQRRGDGSHALRREGEGKQAVVACKPVVALVRRISKFPCADGAEGEARRQRSSRNQTSSDGLKKLVRQTL
jgi:predicted RNA-binding Zn-ribbon protein involved in translation (DUF1610 family)